MMKRLLITTLILLPGLTLTAYGIERFPPPDFESGYELPSTETPHPQRSGWEWIDTGVLLACLVLASWLALKNRSRRGIFLLTIFALIYFGFWRNGCVCPIGAIQNVSMAIGGPEYVIPMVVILFFALPLLSTLLFGRTFCAAVCPLGAIQDVVLWKPHKVPFWLGEALSFFAYIYLGLAVLFAATGSAYIICQYDPFVGFFRLNANFDMLVVGLCFLLIAMFVGRPYCRFLCPYGVILRLFSRVSQWRIRITPAECIQCRLCEDSCPFDAIHKPAKAPTPQNYRRGKITLIALIALSPLIIAAFIGLGALFSPALSRMHYDVRLADRIYLEETGRVEGTDDASEAFRATGRSIEDLTQQAESIQSRFHAGAMWLGAFLGVALSIKLINLTLRRTRTDYEADRGLCFACGRCYDYCPVDRKTQQKE